MAAVEDSAGPSGDAEADAGGSPAPLVVEYDPHTGVPPEFNEFLPPDCIEYKRWRAALEGPEALERLTLRDDDGNEIEKQLPGGKVKKKAKPEVVIETATRNRKKSVTTVTGLDAFGIKLSEAAKLFGKKFACGSSVVKCPSGGEQIDIQGAVLDDLPDYLVHKFKGKGLGRGSVYAVVGKKKRKYYDDEDEDDLDE